MLNVLYGSTHIQLWGLFLPVQIYRPSSQSSRPPSATSHRQAGQDQIFSGFSGSILQSNSNHFLKDLITDLFLPEKSQYWWQGEHDIVCLTIIRIILYSEELQFLRILDQCDKISVALTQDFQTWFHLFRNYCLITNQKWFTKSLLTNFGIYKLQDLLFARYKFYKTGRTWVLSYNLYMHSKQ